MRRCTPAAPARCRTVPSCRIADVHPAAAREQLRQEYCAALHSLCPRTHQGRASSWVGGPAKSSADAMSTATLKSSWNGSVELLLVQNTVVGAYTRFGSTPTNG